MAKVTLVKKQDAKRFRAGEWVMVSGIDIVGKPWNLRKHEFLEVESIDPKTGTMVLKQKAARRRK